MSCNARMKASATALAIVVGSILIISGNSHAQCYGSLALSKSFFEFDYLARLCVHFGDESSLPEYIQCSRSMPPPQVFEVPIYVYNLHEGVERLEFSVESNDSIVGFTPENCFQVVGGFVSHFDGHFKIDLELEACQPLCGPVLVGWVDMERSRDVDPIWIELSPNSLTGRMVAVDSYGSMHNAFSPNHGGYIGTSYLYACQSPLCEEPNAPVENFAASMGHGCSVELAWIAGGGNKTIVRYRTDRFPAGYEDGELVIELDSSPGESQHFVHTHIPEGAMLYYKAFSLTRNASGTVMNNSFVECASTDTTYVECEIGVESVSWGTIKKKYE